MSKNSVSHTYPTNPRCIPATTKLILNTTRHPQKQTQTQTQTQTQRREADSKSETHTETCMNDYEVSYGRSFTRQAVIWNRKKG